MTTCAVLGTLTGGLINSGMNVLRFLCGDPEITSKYDSPISAFLNGFINGMVWGLFFGITVGVLLTLGPFIALAVGLNFGASYYYYTLAKSALEAGDWASAVQYSFLCLFSVTTAFVTYSSAVDNKKLAEEQAKGSVKGDLSKLTPDEKEAVSELVARGDKVEIIPTDLNKKTPDFYVNGVKTELKTLNGSSMNTAVTRVQNGFTQGADNVILDATKTSITVADAQSIIERAQGSYPNKTLPGNVEIWTNEGVVTGG